MKIHPYLYFLVVWISLTTFSTLSAQSNNYHKDALQLAARLSSEEAIFELPEHLVYTLEDALAAVAESPYYAAQTVHQHYNIRPVISSSTQRLRLVVDNSAKWLENVKGNNPIRRQLNKRGLQLCISEQAAHYTTVELFSAQPLNMKYIANKLSLIDKIWLVEIPSEQAIEQDIQVQVMPDGYRLIYCHRAEAGSRDLHYWEFLAYSSGEVTFVGEYGAVLNPPPPPPGERL